MLMTSVRILTQVWEDVLTLWGLAALLGIRETRVNLLQCLLFAYIVIVLWICASLFAAGYAIDASTRVVGKRTLCARL